MRERGIDVLLVSSPENVFYVSDVPTSFTASNRLLFCSRRISPIFCILPKEGAPVLVLSAAALDVVRRHTWIKDLRLYPTGTYIWRKTPPELNGSNYLEVLSKTISEKLDSGKSISSIAIEMNDISVNNYQSIQKKFSEANFVDGYEVLMLSRMIKKDEEIRRFKKANDILCKVMKKIEREMKDRPSEQELDIILKSEMMEEGAESWMQTTIAAGKISGPDIYNQPVPKRKIKRGDVIRMDVGCVYRGYTADLSRTFAVEEAPPRARNTYKVLLQAFLKYIDDFVLGTTASKINLDVVEYVRKNLDKEYYRGNVGHGVGVELYDKPILGAEDHTPLQQGMTLSYEVPYHIFGLAGLNIEDSILMTNKGKRIVSKYDRDLIIV
jgi:Xaa-Pro dipeptidase